MHTLKRCSIQKQIPSASYLAVQTGLLQRRKRRPLVCSACVWLASIFGPPSLRLVGLLVLPGLIPERQFDPVPEAELVVDYAEVVLDNVFGSAEGIRNFPVLAAFGDELDDGMFSLAGTSGGSCFSDHSCLL